MKAVLCPVCRGEGKVTDNSNYSTTSTTQIKKTCHGCRGFGWVEVGDYAFEGDKDIEQAISKYNYPMFKD